MTVPDTLYLENQFGEQSQNYIIGGNAPASMTLAQLQTALQASSTGSLFMQRIAVGFAALNAAGSGVALLLGLAIPDKAIIKQVFYNVKTTFVDNGTSGNADSSTIAMGLNTGVDVKAAIAISNGANPWDVGIAAGIQVGTAAAMSKNTAARQLAVTWTHGSGDSTLLTAGAMDVFIEWAPGT